jgi:beta-glucanase (GH16 family)
MKTSLFLSAALGLSQVAAGQAMEWKQVFADEFNYTGAPDPKKWGYEYGKVRNGEAQTYTNDPSNVSVANGLLTITARKQSRDGAAYTSASLQTLSDDRSVTHFAFTGGRMEIRAKLPASKGSWVAFWTLGVNSWKGESWPKGGEIDVMEYVTNDNPHVTYGNIHYQGTDGQHKHSVAAYDPRRTNLNAPAMSADWHTFRVDWYADRMEWYVDDVKYHSVAIDPKQASGTPFTAPHYLIVNYALGGNWGGAIDPNFVSDQYQVDYVRVYQQTPVVPEPAAGGAAGGAVVLLLLRRRTHLE